MNMKETKDQEIKRLLKQSQYPNSIGDLARFVLDQYQKEIQVLKGDE